MLGLNALVAPMSLETFFDHYHRREFHIGAVDAPLPGWDELNRALERASVEDRARFSFSSDGGVEPDPDDIWMRSGDLCVRAVRDRIRRGDTFIFNNFNLYSEVFGALERDVRARYCEHLNVNCYVSMRPKVGFGPHWDDHDVFAVQLEGRKYWALYGFTDPCPLARTTTTPLPPGAKPIWEGYLEKGQSLYVPRGMWHSAVSTGAPSMHAACGVRGPTGVDVIYWLAACARDVPELRAALRPSAAAHGAHKEVSARIRAFLETRTGCDLVERFMKDRVIQAEPRAMSGFPDTLTFSDEDMEGALIRYSGPETLETWQKGNQRVTVIGGTEIVFPLQALPALRRLAARGEAVFASLRDAAPEANAQDIISLVRELDAAGAALALTNHSDDSE